MQDKSFVFTPFKDIHWLISLEMILALLMGLCFIALGVGGGAWILGGIAAGALVFWVYRSRYNAEAKPNRNARKIGQILVGLTIGFSIQHGDLFALASQLPIFGLLTLFLLLSGGLIGYLYSRIQKTDLLTAMLATVPGNIGVMASLAADYQKDPALVSLIQLIRFTTIIVIVPMIANISNSHDVVATIHSLTKDLFTVDIHYTAALFLLLFITFVAIQVGKQFKIPVATFFCPIVVGLLFNSLLNKSPLALHSQFMLPPIINLVGQALLGMTIGEYWAINPRLEKRTITLALIPVMLTFLAGLISVGIARLLTPWDWLTCLLVASPGGSPEMILIALTLHQNVEIVTAGHLVRLMMINFSLPILISFACYLENRAKKVQLTASEQQTETVT